MPENINGTNLLSSGGHGWQWSGPAGLTKRISTAGVKGEYAFSVGVGARPGRIAGAAQSRGPALLCATGATRALADAALTAIEAPIEALIESGQAVAWEDDAGRSGSRLVLTAYRPMGPRTYGMQGATHHAWQHYVIEFVELDGGW